jgi:hypothetical protein
MFRDRGHRSVCDCHQDRHRRRMARNTGEPTLNVADGIWGSHLQLDGSSPNIDHGMAPAENMRIRPQYHK